MEDGQIIVFEKDKCSKGHHKRLGIMPLRGDKNLRASIYCECDLTLWQLFEMSPIKDCIIMIDGTAMDAITVIMDAIKH